MSANKYGIPEDEWALRDDTVYALLREQARLGRVTTYTEVNVVMAQRSGLRTLDFGSANERAAMGGLLGAAARRSNAEHHVMISSIVLYLNENDAGPGFYELALALGYFPDPLSADQRLKFWSSQVAETHAAYF